MEYCAERGLPCLDLLPVVTSAHESGADALYYAIDRHFTPNGMKLVADAIYEFLVRERAPALSAGSGEAP
jgi:hypothetical protein